MKIRQEEQVLRLSLKVKKFPLELEHQNGDIKKYELREADGEGRDQFMSLINDRAERDAKGQPTGKMKSMDGLQTLLVSICLYDEEGKRVPRDVVGSWRSEVIGVLFAKAQELSGLIPSQKEMGNG